MNASERAALHAALSALIFKPTTPTVLAPMREDEPEELEPELEAEEAAAGAEGDGDEQQEQEETCRTCGGSDTTATNEILLCDGCDAAYHMLCLPRPLPNVPEGDWFCHVCKPRFTKEDEHTMQHGVGAQLWAQDKKGLWGKAKVVKFKSAVPPGSAAESADDDGGAKASTSQPSKPSQESSSSSSSQPATSTADANVTSASDEGQPAHVLISFKGYSSKYDEWIPVGVGKLRPLEEGPPMNELYGDEFYVMGEVIDMRQKGGR